MGVATVAATVARQLRASGVRWVCGLPGGETLDLMAALQAEGLTFVLTRHETAAAIMAATVGELGPAPGVCLSTLGPGATNMVTGVAQAYLDRSPLVAISAQVPEGRQAVLTHQMLDLAALYRPVTKWVATVNAANAARVTRKALAVAAAWPTGPVHLTLPSDGARQEALAEPLPFPAAPSPAVTARTFDAGDLAAVRALVAVSEHPALIVGLVAARAGAGEAARALAEWLGCPVYDLPKAKGVFPPDHPQFVGTLEMAGTRVLFEQLAACDLIVAFGVDPVEFDRWWDFPARVVTFDLQPNLTLHLPSHAEVVGPLGAAVAALTAGSRPRPQRDCTSLRRQLAEAVAAEAAPGRLHPRLVVERLRAALPAGAILATDTGAHKMAAGQFWRTGQPLTYLVSNGLSTMGFAIPAALGARLARPEAAVAALTGDGGFLMAAGELETAARLRLDLLVVVMVDDALGSIRLSQARRGYPEQGVRFGPVDHVALARGLGAAAWEVASPAELDRALAEARRVPGPALIAARVDGDAYRL
jgi:acetolactate synthase-1/2/3 large subunit